MDTVVNTSINIPATLHAQLVSLAEEYQESVEAILLKAAKTIVEETKRRKAWRQEGIDAWEEYKETGLHLNNAEMKEWLFQLSSENDVVTQVTSVVWSPHALQRVHRLHSSVS